MTWRSGRIEYRGNLVASVSYQHRKQQGTYAVPVLLTLDLLQGCTFDVFVNKHVCVVIYNIILITECIGGPEKGH